MIHEADIERIYATDRQVLVRRGGKFVLIDLDEESGRGGNAVGLAIIWTLMVLIGVAVMWRAGAL